ncbi:MAG: penicillin-binding protein activator [Bradymonadia bacterium]|jgi:ABC-type branched-subunit amino acid transport system substrate-binding protein
MRVLHLLLCLAGLTLGHASAAGADALAPLRGKDVDAARAWVDGQGTATLEALTRSLPTADPALPWIALRLARLALHTGDTGAAARWTDLGLKPGYESHPARPMLAEVKARIAARTRFEPRRIGVLLPLSGPYGAIGREVQRAVELAASTERDVRLILEDTRGDADGVGAAVDRLVHLHGVAAIVGPIGALESREAAIAAERFEVPLVTLSAAEGVTGLGTHVFRHRLTREAEARALAVHAVRRLGLRTFGVLYARNDHGLALRNAFWKQVELLGGEVRAAEGYDPGASEYSEPIKRLAGRAPIEARRGEADGGDAARWAEINRKAKDPSMRIPPRVDFEGLFVADGGDRARLLLPFLTYWDIELKTHPEQTNDTLWSKYGGDPPPLVQLLLTHAFADPERARRAGENARNAVFLADYTTSTPEGAAFAEVWTARMGRSPDPLAAHAWDATRRLLDATDGARSRAEVRARLLDRTDWRGATGPSRFEASGELSMRLQVLTIDAADEVVPRVEELDEPESSGP